MCLHQSGMMAVTYHLGSPHPLHSTSSTNRGWVSAAILLLVFAKYFEMFTESHVSPNCARPCTDSKSEPFSLNFILQHALKLFSPHPKLNRWNLHFTHLCPVYFLVSHKPENLSQYPSIVKYSACALTT